MKIKMVRYGLLHEKYTLYDIDNMIIEYHNFNDQYGDISRDLEIINYGYTKSVQLAPFMLSFLRNIRLPFNFDLYVHDVKTEGGDEILREVLQAMPYEFKDIIDNNRDNIAAVIMEPIRRNYPSKGYLEEIRAIDSVYYKTNKDDYLKPKVLKIKKNK